MPYKDITYDNGFTERVYYNMTATEEAERFKSINRVRTFPSVNHKSSLKKSSICKDEKPQSWDDL